MSDLFKTKNVKLQQTSCCIYEIFIYKQREETPLNYFSLTEISSIDDVNIHFAK